MNNNIYIKIRRLTVDCRCKKDYLPGKDAASEGHYRFVTIQQGNMQYLYGLVDGNGQDVQARIVCSSTMDARQMVWPLALKSALRRSFLK